MQISKASSEHWIEHPVTIALFNELKDRKMDLSASLISGAAFGEEEPLREIYRNVALIRLIDEILELEIFEIKNTAGDMHEKENIASRRGFDTN